MRANLRSRARSRVPDTMETARRSGSDRVRGVAGVCARRRHSSPRAGRLGGPRERARTSVRHRARSRPPERIAAARRAGRQRARPARPIVRPLHSALDPEEHEESPGEERPDEPEDSRAARDQEPDWRAGRGDRQSPVAESVGTAQEHHVHLAAALHGFEDSARAYGSTSPPTCLNDPTPATGHAVADRLAPRSVVPIRRL